MIKIFKEKLDIDLERLISTRFLVCANSGGGKSYAVRKLLEESHGKVMSIVLDVEGEFKTLRENYDFLLIGENADVSLSMKAAKLLPKKLLELNVSTIIDISDLKRGERIRYVKDFLNGMMSCPRQYWKPCLVVLDEAHMLAGQQEKQDSCASVIDLMTRGRKRGFCGVLCTQRISKLHKDAVAECNNVMIGRTGLDIDMKRASEILGFTSKKDMLSLRDLQAGEFFVFGTAIIRGVTKIKVGEVKTTHPKVGMDLTGKIHPPTTIIKAKLSSLENLPQEVEKEAKSLSDLRNENALLKRELSKKPSKILSLSVDQKDIEKAKKETLKAAEKSYSKAIIQLQREYSLLQKNKSKQIGEIKKLLDRCSMILGEEDPIKTPIMAVKPLSEVSKKEFKTLTAIGNYGHEKSPLGKCEATIYSFLFGNPDKSFTKVQIATVTGYSVKSGGFNNAIYSLNSKGLISREDGYISLEKIDQSLTNGNTPCLDLELWFKKLGKCAASILKVLIDNPDREFSKQEISEITGYSESSGGFNNSIYKLNSLDLIKRKNSQIKVNPEIIELY